MVKSIKLLKEKDIEHVFSEDIFIKYIKCFTKGKNFNELEYILSSYQELFRIEIEGEDGVKKIVVSYLEDLDVLGEYDIVYKIKDGVGTESRIVDKGFLMSSKVDITSEFDKSIFDRYKYKELLKLLQKKITA